MKPRLPQILLAAFLIIVGGCTSDEDVVKSDEDRLLSTDFYSCEGNIVFSIERLSDTSVSVQLYKGKRRLAGRSLSKSGDVYGAEDLRVDISGEIPQLIWNDRTYASCKADSRERERRLASDTLFYITNTGSLITAVPEGDSAMVTLTAGNSVIHSETIPRVKSASGVKYEQGNTMFWTRDNVAMFAHSGQMFGDCIRIWKDEMREEPCPSASTRTFIANYVRDSLQFDEGAYRAEAIDLNGDGKDEYIVALVGPMFCGSGGCTWLVLDVEMNVITRGSVADFPIYVAEDMTNGFRDLYIFSDKGYHVLKYDGSTYPSNPSVAPEIDLFAYPEEPFKRSTRILDLAYVRQCEI